MAVLNGDLVGCSMIAQGEQGNTLQPIFVAPREQRRGIATQLLVGSAKHLADHGLAELRSQCNLGNEVSMAWHANCGFQEIPSHLAAGHRANIYTQEAERQERLQLSTCASNPSSRPAMGRPVRPFRAMAVTEPMNGNNGDTDHLRWQQNRCMAPYGRSRPYR